MSVMEEPINSLPFNGGTAHSTSSAQLEELAAVFALEALPPEELQAYVGHLGVCDVCRRVASQFQVIAGLLPEALAEEQGSPGLRRRIISLAREDVRRQARRGVGRSRPRLSWLAPVRVGWLAGLALLAGLVIWNINLQLGLGQQSDLLAEQSALVAALAGGAKVSRLVGTQVAPEASATLVQVPQAERAFLLVRNLPSLPSDREYQVWRITGGVPVSAGTFTLGGAEEQLITVTADLTSAEAIGISREPKGGSARPTGPIVILGAP